MKKLFQYCVLLHTYEQKEKEKVYLDTQIVIEPKVALAMSERELLFKVTREIPEQYVSDPENVQIVIRNF